MSDYYKLLKDPRWQKRRLEILEQAEFRCIQCESEEKTLHVHHTIYRKGKKPWEYSDHDLQVLCESCHGDRHESESELKEALAGASIYDYDNLIGYLTGVRWGNEAEGEINGVHPDFTDGFCKALRLDDSRLWSYLSRNDYKMSYSDMMKKINYLRL